MSTPNMHPISGIILIVAIIVVSVIYVTHKESTKIVDTDNSLPQGVDINDPIAIPEPDAEPDPEPIPYKDLGAVAGQIVSNSNQIATPQMLTIDAEDKEPKPIAFDTGIAFIL
jgi:hypothetical protein